MRNLFKLIIVLVFASVTNYANAKDFQSNETPSAVSKEQSAVIDSVKGCWRNMETGSWDIAFMDKYAIYNCKLWQYDKVSKKGSKNRTKIALTLKNGDRTVLVKLSKEVDSVYNIAIDKSKAVSYNLCGKTLGDYPFKDTTSLAHYPYRNDTVSFSGVLYSSSADKNVQGDIIFYDLISNEEYIFPMKLDSLGYFNIKIPIINSQYLNLRIGSGRKRIFFDMTYIEPGKRYFFLFDVDTRQTLMMGDDVRVQNEMLTHNVRKLNLPTVSDYYDEYEEMSPSHLLKLSEENFTKRKQIVKDYVNRFPTLSERYRYWIDDVNSYDIARDMGQKRFSVKSGEIFPDEYMDFMEQKFIDKTIYPKTISQSFSRFLYDYIPFRKEGRKTGISVSDGTPYDKIILELEKMQIDTFSLREKELFDFFCHSYLDSLMYYTHIKKDTVATNRYSKKYRSFADSLGKVFEAHPILQSEEVKAIQKRLAVEEMIEDTRLEFEKIKEKSQSDEVAQIAIAKEIYSQLENRQEAFDTMKYNMFNEYVTNDAFKQHIVALQNKFEKLKDKDFIGASVHSDEAITDGEQLFNKIMAPHKGKVVFLDIWGTWCSPCREEMKHMGKIKEGLKDRDVVYVYLANRSPEKSWKNAIISLGVDGKENIHYNLPSEQQQMIETFIGIKGYPTYRLIDKKGRIVNTKPPRPSQGKMLIDAIKKVFDN